MALIKLETYYSFPNIEATNNCMKIRIDKGMTLQYQLDIKDVNYQIDFAVENSLQRVLGLDPRIYEHGSENLVDSMSMNLILVHHDINIHVNGIEASVIYNFFPNATPGDKIVSTTRNLIYIPIALNIISHMTCWLNNQNGNKLDLRREELTITFYIKAC